MFVTASLIPRYCSKCDKNVNRWTDRPDWSTCDCGENLQDIEIFRKSDGDKQEFFSQELGLLGEQQRQYKLKHPDTEFNQTGAMKIKNQKHLDKVLSEKGMVCLTDSREYREQTAERLEKARDGKFNLA